MKMPLIPACAALLLCTAPAMAALPVGAPAPGFATQASLAGKPMPFDLARALKKGPVVLYFYPAAFTSGCTVEAHDFAEATDEFHKLGATVIGMSADPIDVLNRFSVAECRNKFAVGSATPRIIADYDVKLATSSRANRTSYVIAPDGRILFAYSAMDPAGHVAKTLAAVKAWKAQHKG
ncbi:peroxiredoxin [Sphingomonas morindae]|uniref:thioredoxin-dependent peroxiredoxin n=1 Tax=Sphingomonas morindae TaxID=1541170 RepID=A0ABY4X7Z0_9SPHN|nr:peroxiredoxin [Sphingomonas morindae]USI73062.1 peroxiredoxin [Sphingomonas morindae]